MITPERETERQSFLRPSAGARLGGLRPRSLGPAIGCRMGRARIGHRLDRRGSPAKRRPAGGSNGPKFSGRARVNHLWKSRGPRWPPRSAAAFGEQHAAAPAARTPVWVRSPLMRLTLTKSLVPPAFALLTCIAGCDREAKNGQLPAAGPSAADSPVIEDERLSRLLLGSWESKDEGSAVTETLFPDGTSTGTVTTTLETGTPLVVSLWSTWRIEGKRIHERITASKPAFVPVGTTFADEIITLDGEKLVTRAEDGELETRRRVTKQSGSDPADYPPLLHSGPNARSPAPEKH